MDVEEFLKKNLNSRGQIRNKDLKKIIPKLKLIVDQKTKGKTLKRSDLTKLLHDSLREIGWNKEQISKLSIPKRSSNNSKNISPSFENYKPNGGRVTRFKNGKFHQGGSPGLGKGKSWKEYHPNTISCSGVSLEDNRF